MIVEPATVQQGTRAWVRHVAPSTVTGGLIDLELIERQGKEC